MALTKTGVLITAMRTLASDVKSDDGVANAAIAEAADRLERYANALQAIKRHCQDAVCREWVEERHYTRAIQNIRSEIDSYI